MNTIFGIFPANSICFALEGYSASIQAVFIDISAFFGLFGITLPNIGGFFPLFVSCPVNVFPDGQAAVLRRCRDVPTTNCPDVATK